MFRANSVALAVLALVAFAAEAQGAFLPPDFTQPWDQEPSSGAAALPEREPLNLPSLVLAAIELDVAEFALHSSGGGSSGGAGSNVAPSSSFDVVAVGVPLALCASKENGDYRIRESRCRLPVPLLSGVFRPPRIMS